MAVEDMDEDDMKVGLSGEDAPCRSKWIVGNFCH